jgi:DNA topoisomerase-2
MGNNIIEITELPIEDWTSDYKVFLNEFHIDNKNESKSNLEIEQIKEFHKGNTVYFKLRLTDKSYEHVLSLTEEARIKLFKLGSSFSLTNMNLFDPNGKIKKYIDVYEIINEYYERRIELYEKRRLTMITKLNYQIEINSNKAKFVKLINENNFNFKQSKDEIFSYLQENSNNLTNFRFPYYF